MQATTTTTTTSSGQLPVLLALLVLINLIVIMGNILVIVAVYASAKLRSVTNIFIVSLATADLLLGILVLPYALVYEVSHLVALPVRVTRAPVTTTAVRCASKRVLWKVIVCF